LPLLALLPLALPAAGTAHARDMSAAVFRSPAAFAGRQVTVCGHMPDIANIRRGPRPSDKGLAVALPTAEIARSLRGGGRRCLEGEIFATGCDGEPCSGWAYPFGIKVRRAIVR
jgi:hypothetical protein